MTRAAVVVVILVALALPANAFETGGLTGGTGGGTISTGLTTSDPGKPGQGNAGDGTTPLVTRVPYRVVPPGEHKDGDLSAICYITTERPVRTGIYFQVLTLDVTGKTVDDSLYCQETHPGEPVAPPVLPAPPTVAEVWKSAHIPAPDVITDPIKRGITGLETRISTRSASTVQISASIRGYTVVGTAILDHYTISVDGGASVVADHDTYTFENKGNHKIAVGAVWTGTATLYSDTFDKPIFLGDIGTATITATLTYPVNEIRSVLQP